MLRHARYSPACAFGHADRLTSPRARSQFEQQEALAPQAAACGELIIALNSYLQALAPAIERLLRAQGKGPGSFKVRMGGGHMLHLGITLVVVLFCSWLLVQYYQRVRAGIPIRSLGQGAP